LIKYGSLNKKTLPYVSGINLSISMNALKGNRIILLNVKDSDGLYKPLDLDRTYRTVVNNFIAAGGDGFNAFKNAKGFRTNTGIIDSDAFRDLLKSIGTILKPTEQRIKVISTGEQISLFTGQADNYEISEILMVLAA